MNKSEFLQIIKSIKPSKHIVAGRRGSEENVKTKIVLPLLQFLGYDIIKDLDFELLGTDIAVINKNLKPILIIETKSWEAQIKNHLDQCLEYTFKLRTPFIVITSGQHTALYSSLINLNDLSKTKPIIEFDFDDLLDKNAESILSKLYLLVSKDSLLNRAEELNKSVTSFLSEGRNINEAKKEFIEKCAKFKSKIKTAIITDDDFVELANNYPKEIYNALVLGKDEFYKIAQENNDVRIRYRSKSIGLEYVYMSGPRVKVIGLVEINPSGGWIAFGMEGWTSLLSSKEIIKRLKDFPKTIKNENQIHKLIKLLEDGLKNIDLK